MDHDNSKAEDFSESRLLSIESFLVHMQILCSVEWRWGDFVILRESAQNPIVRLTSFSDTQGRNSLVLFALLLAQHSPNFLSSRVLRLPSWHSGPQQSNQVSSIFAIFMLFYRFSCKRLLMHIFCVLPPLMPSCYFAAIYVFDGFLPNTTLYSFFLLFVQQNVCCTGCPNKFEIV